MGRREEVKGRRLDRERERKRDNFIERELYLERYPHLESENRDGDYDGMK